MGLFHMCSLAHDWRRENGKWRRDIVLAWKTNFVLAINTGKLKNKSHGIRENLIWDLQLCERRE